MKLVSRRQGAPVFPFRVNCAKVCALVTEFIQVHSQLAIPELVIPDYQLLWTTLYVFGISLQILLAIPDK